MAYGANAAPERLRRKFAPVDQTVFPVLNARLHDFDVVHAAHISSYGAVPATIEHSPGTACDIAITWLDERELARMHETEFRRHTYLFGQLNNVRLEPDLLPAMDAVSSYVGGFGHIAPQGEPLALAAVRAEGRRFRTCSQTEALQTIQAMLGVPGPLDAFIQEAIDDDAVRRPAPRYSGRRRSPSPTAILRRRRRDRQPSACAATMPAKSARPTRLLFLNLARQSAGLSIRTRSACQASSSAATATPT